MIKFEPTPIRCQDCGFTMEVFHRIVPPTQLENLDPLGIERVSGCKAKEQQVVCPQCKNSHFLPIETPKNMNSLI